MDKLTNNTLLIIFKLLNLNDRSCLRIVCKKFKLLIDSIKIKKCVIYKGLPPVPGKFKLINERYDLVDCVYVYDLDQFFNTKFVINCLEKIEYLYIMSWNHGIVNTFKRKFKELKYFESDSVTLLHSDILKSSNLEGLSLYQTYFNEAYDLMSSKVTVSVHDFGFQNLISNRLKHFNGRNITEIQFFFYCFNKGIFDQIETMSVHIHSLEALIYISKKFRTLKMIDASIGLNVDDFTKKYLNEHLLETTFDKLRNGLKVYLFSYPFRKETISKLVKFLRQIKGKFYLRFSELQLILDDSIYKLLKEHDVYLDRFYSKIQGVSLFNLSSNPSEMFQKMTSCIMFHALVFRTNQLNALKMAICSLTPQIKEITILAEVNTGYDNNLLDLIPKYKNYIYALTVDCWAKINFNFLFNLPNLKYVKLYLVHPMPQDVYLNLIKRSKYLAYFQVYFERKNEQTREQLKSFKELVIKVLTEDLKYKDAIFRIEIHKKDEICLIRYVLKRMNLAESLTPLEADKVDYDKVFNAIEFRNDTNSLK